MDWREVTREVRIVPTSSARVWRWTMEVSEEMGEAVMPVMPVRMTVVRGMRENFMGGWGCII
jgi:hypothetical protein